MKNTETESALSDRENLSPHRGSGDDGLGTGDVPAVRSSAHWVFIPGGDNGLDVGERPTTGEPTVTMSFTESALHGLFWVFLCALISKLLAP